jgi:hypothetical protein
LSLERLKSGVIVLVAAFVAFAHTLLDSLVVERQVGACNRRDSFRQPRP